MTIPGELRAASKLQEDAETRALDTKILRAAILKFYNLAGSFSD